ncbi:MAG: hypothetical protein OHK0012_25850 [Synechococcales cyanobacterium]
MQPLPQTRSEKPLAQRYLNVCQAYLRLNKAYAGLDLNHNELQGKFLHLWQQFQRVQEQCLAVQQEVNHLRQENHDLRQALTQTQVEASDYQTRAEKKMAHLQACYQGVVVLLEQFELLLHSDSLSLLTEAEAAAEADQEFLQLESMEGNRLAAESANSYGEHLFFSTPHERQQAMTLGLAEFTAALPDSDEDALEIRMIEALALAP